MWDDFKRLPQNSELGIVGQDFCCFIISVIQISFFVGTLSEKNLPIIQNFRRELGLHEIDLVLILSKSFSFGRQNFATNNIFYSYSNFALKIPYFCHLLFVWQLI